MSRRRWTRNRCGRWPPDGGALLQEVSGCRSAAVRAYQTPAFCGDQDALGRRFCVARCCLPTANGHAPMSSCRLWLPVPCCNAPPPGVLPVFGVMSLACPAQRDRVITAPCSEAPLRVTKGCACGPRRQSCPHWAQEAWGLPEVVSHWQAPHRGVLKERDFFFFFAKDSP